MPRKISIVLSDELGDFVDREVACGRYGSAGEVLHEGLRLLEERALRRDRLKAAILDGEESGVGAAFDMDSFIEDQNAAWTWRA